MMLPTHKTTDPCACHQVLRRVVEMAAFCLFPLQGLVKRRFRSWTNWGARLRSLVFKVWNGILSQSSVKTYLEPIRNSFCQILVMIWESETFDTAFVSKSLLEPPLHRFWKRPKIIEQSLFSKLDEALVLRWAWEAFSIATSSTKAVWNIWTSLWPALTTFYYHFNYYFEAKHRFPKSFIFVSKGHRNHVRILDTGPWKWLPSRPSTNCKL